MNSRKVQKRKDIVDTKKKVREYSFSLKSEEEKDRRSFSRTGKKEEKYESGKILST